MVGPGKTDPTDPNEYIEHYFKEEETFIRSLKPMSEENQEKFKDLFEQKKRQAQTTDQDEEGPQRVLPETEAKVGKPRQGPESVFSLSAKAPDKPKAKEKTAETPASRAPQASNRSSGEEKIRESAVIPKGSNPQVETSAPTESGKPSPLQAASTVFTPPIDQDNTRSAAPHSGSSQPAAPQKSEAPPSPVFPSNRESTIASKAKPIGAASHLPEDTTRSTPRSVTETNPSHVKVVSDLGEAGSKEVKTSATPLPNTPPASELAPEASAPPVIGLPKPTESETAPVTAPKAEPDLSPVREGAAVPQAAEKTQEKTVPVERQSSTAHSNPEIPAEQQPVQTTLKQAPIAQPTEAKSPIPGEPDSLSKAPAAEPPLKTPVTTEQTVIGSPVEKAEGGPQQPASAPDTRSYPFGNKKTRLNTHTDHRLTPPEQSVAPPTTQQAVPKASTEKTQPLPDQPIANPEANATTSEAVVPGQPAPKASTEKGQPLPGQPIANPEANATASEAVVPGQPAPKASTEKAQPLPGQPIANPEANATTSEAVVPGQPGPKASTEKAQPLPGQPIANPEANATTSEAVVPGQPAPKASTEKAQPLPSQPIANPEANATASEAVVPGQPVPKASTEKSQPLPGQPIANPEANTTTSEVVVPGQPAPKASTQKAQPLPGQPIANPEANTTTSEAVVPGQPAPKASTQKAQPPPDQPIANPQANTTTSEVVVPGQPAPKASTQKAQPLPGQPIANPEANAKTSEAVVPGQPAPKASTEKAQPLPGQPIANPETKASAEISDLPEQPVSNTKERLSTTTPLDPRLLEGTSRAAEQPVSPSLAVSEPQAGTKQVEETPQQPGTPKTEIPAQAVPKANSSHQPKELPSQIDRPLSPALLGEPVEPPASKGGPASIFDLSASSGPNLNVPQRTREKSPAAPQQAPTPFTTSHAPQAKGPIEQGDARPQEVVPDSVKKPPNQEQPQPAQPMSRIQPPSTEVSEPIPVKDIPQQKDLSKAAMTPTEQSPVQPGSSDHAPSKVTSKPDDPTSPAVRTEQNPIPVASEKRAATKAKSAKPSEPATQPTRTEQPPAPARSGELAASKTAAAKPDELVAQATHTQSESSPISSRGPTPSKPAAGQLDDSTPQTTQLTTAAKQPLREPTRQPTSTPKIEETPVDLIVDPETQELSPVNFVHPLVQAEYNTNRPVTAVEKVTPRESRSVELQQLAEKMLGKLTIMHLAERTVTEFTVKHPPIFDGANIQLTEFSFAKKEYNITFSNLSPEARRLIEAQAHQDQLRSSLAEKGYAVHIIQVTSKENPSELPQISEEELSRFTAKQESSAGEDQREREQDTGQQEEHQT